MVRSVPCSARSGGRRGVALIEVMVASVILGLAVSATLGLAARAISAQSDGERIETAARLADERLNLVLALGCEGYSRSDFIVPRDGSAPVFLETNTLPGLTPRSLLPRAALADGIDYRTLCLWIAAHGIARNAERRNG